MIPEIDDAAPPAAPPHYSLWTMRGRAIAKLSRPDGSRGKPIGIYRLAIETFGARARLAADPDHRVKRFGAGDWHCIGEALRWYDEPGYVAAFAAADRIARGCDAEAVLRAFAVLVERAPVTEWVRCQIGHGFGLRWQDLTSLEPGWVIRSDDRGQYYTWPRFEADCGLRHGLPLRDEKHATGAGWSIVPWGAKRGEA